MTKRITNFFEHIRPKIFKLYLNGKTYRSNCRTHFDVFYWDVTNISSTDVPPNILINIRVHFKVSEEEFGNISLSILNVSQTSSRIYVHDLIPKNSSRNIINSRFIVREKENLLKSNGIVVHYIFEENKWFNLTYSIESTHIQNK